MKKATILSLLICLLCLTSRSHEDFQDEIANDNSTSCSITDYEIGIPPEFPDDKKNISTFFMTTVAMVAAVCNILIIYVVLFNEHMRTTTNFLIVNMAVGDLISTVIGTSWTVKYMQTGSEWDGNKIFGEFIWCKLGCPLYYICMLCSIYSLLAITFDRFLAVAHPFQYKHYSSWTTYTIPAIWLASTAVPMHLVIVKMKFCLIKSKFYCITKKSPFDALLLLSLGFILPHVVIVILYIAIAYKLWKRRVPGMHRKESQQTRVSTNKVARKVTRMIVCILLAFQVSWGPVFYGYVFPYLYLTNETQAYADTFYFKCMMISNGIFNAFIYAFFNDNFRCAFKEVLLCKHARKALEKLRARGKIEPDGERSYRQSGLNNTSDAKTLEETVP